MLRAILYLSTSGLKVYLFSISLARLNWIYDVIICLVPLTQMFATADHNIKMFSKIATFLQNQFKNWFVTSFLIRFSNFFQQTKGYFKASPIVYDMYNQY